MIAADKIEAARALIEPLRATVLWQNANPNVMKAADLLAALADLADAQAQEIARLRGAVKAADALFEQASSVHLGGHLPMAKIHSSARCLGPLLTVYQRVRAALGDAP